MQNDVITAEIDALHHKLNSAFENKDVALYINQFDEDLKYTNADATVYDRKELLYQTEKLFQKTKAISTTYYRIKSSFENDVFEEKIARKSVVYVKGLLFAKKQTIQTEELYHWKNVGGAWKATAVEIVLEEKY
ncbi:nuclear transport factor 2 family protein [Pedobacter sandarakinus]|uniref:nuclear transport factor 2 family protein n=1 Tax=Pedobacter sandarakinus TaxID=353156 RepID=UPI002247134A|nr:nuclear transport factor 2 family protein [Pedobacter sandarakinus]MCX2573860.1 nuclear transport factor 2 family protein [Pedobacter sandarakinus]